MRKLIGVIDQSTTSSKFTVYDEKGQKIAFSQKDHKQITPHEGWLEHDPMEILQNVEDVMADVKKQLKEEQITTIGITNQRETTIAWNKQNGKPYYNAIVWSDTRCSEKVMQLAKEKGNINQFKPINGLLISTYFSAFKIQWLLENIPVLKSEPENVLFGTIDSFLLFHLTSNFLTDLTNASRTFLLNLSTLQYEPSLLSHFGIEFSQLPEIRPCGSAFGKIQKGVMQGVQINAVIGDQQAAGVGHGVFQPGDMKATYGTGCFLIMNVGDKPIVKQESGLISTVLLQLGKDQPVQYGFEGSIGIGGNTLNWLRDQMCLLNNFDELQLTITSVANTGGVLFCPSFGGLLSPYWLSESKGTIKGITQQTNRNHIVRSVVEAIAYRNFDVIRAFQEDFGAIGKIKVDGGLTRSDFLMQFQADLIQQDIFKSEIMDATSYGAMKIAAFQAGIVKDIYQFEEQKEQKIGFDVQQKEQMELNYQKWQEFIQKNYLQ